jgi:hypothetical protein
VKRFAMIAVAVVHRSVASATEIVQEAALLATDRLAIREAVDQFELRLFCHDGQADLCRRALREDFAELPKLEESDDRIRGEVLLGLSRKRHETRVVMREVGEVGRGRRGQRNAGIHGTRNATSASNRAACVGHTTS